MNLKVMLILKNGDSQLNEQKKSDNSSFDILSVVFALDFGVKFKESLP